MIRKYLLSDGGFAVAGLDARENGRLCVAAKAIAETNP
jgi:hypothetical protein